MTLYAIRLPNGDLITDPDWHSVGDVMRGSHAFDVREMPGELIKVTETCTNPHTATCPRRPNTEEPVNLVRLDEGCDAAYVCTDCKCAWDVAWGCA